MNTTDQQQRFWDHTLDAAQAQGLLMQPQLAPLKTFFAEQLRVPNQAAELIPDVPTEVAKFSFAHVLYYFGGLIAIGALSIFATLGVEQMGFGFLLVVSIAYAVLAIGLTEWFLQRRHVIPAGITAALAVTMVPLGVFSLQQLAGFWDGGYGAQHYQDFHYYIDWRWILMELATLAAGAVALWRYRLPFLMMPVAVVGWYLSMDIARFLSEDPDGWSFNRPAGIIVGLLMVIVSLLLDKRTKRAPDLGFWLCLFGAMSFWGAISWSDSDIWWHKHVYAMLSIAMVFSGALLNRRIFTVLGALSFAGYLGWLSFNVFQNSMLFPFALCAVGLGVVFFGIWWQRHEAYIALSLRRWIANDVVAG
jgi:hypothetical protein